jgi:hypothetical protein
LTHLRRHGDAGQAFPIYITVVGGLLFLALAYFAVGQAAATRSEAQTAADAAALAAALETRDQLADQWLTNILEPGSWQDIFDGEAPVSNACWRAHELAARNDASVTCQPDGLLGYTATESATAVIAARCSFELPVEEASGDVLPTLFCKSTEWELKPDDLSNLPQPEDLFDVHLAD